MCFNDVWILIPTLCIFLYAQEIICYLECLLGQAQPFRDKCVRKSFPLVATVDGTKATAARIIPGEGIYNDAGDTFSPYVDNIGEHTEVKNGATGLWDLGPNSLAVSIATQMEKIQGYDSGCSNKENMAQQQQHRFSTRTKDSIGIPAEDYPCEHVENEQDAADTTQKNSFRDLALLGINQVRTPFSEITPFLRESNGSSTLKGKQLQFLSSRDCVHSLSNISGDAECSNMTPGSNPIESVQNHGSTSLCGESSSSQGYERFNSRHPRGKKSVKAVQTDDSQNPSFERKEPEPSSHGVPCPESKGGTLKTPQAVETGCNGFSPASTNVKQLIGKLQEASGPRSLGRRASCRTPRVSYTLPRLNSKLRQGDPFTFGDPSILPRKSKESVSVKKKNRYFVSGKVEPR